MKVSIKGFITCKNSEQYIDCADNYAVSKSNHRFSVSDGVSKSFFSKIWSEILVNQFVVRTDLKENEFIKVCQDEWHNRIGRIVSLPDTKWFTKFQYNRKDPALATFVGLQIYDKEKEWFAEVIGDSFLFFVPKDYNDYQKELIKVSSKGEPIVFDNFPDYLSSIGNLHKGEKNIRREPLKNGTFYLMTDALAEWFIKEGEYCLVKVAGWESQMDFEEFVKRAIEDNKLTNDDCAVLCVELSGVEINGIEYQKDLVTNLNDLINNQKVRERLTKPFIIEEEEKNKNRIVEYQEEKKLEISQNELFNSERTENLYRVEPLNNDLKGISLKRKNGLVSEMEKEHTMDAELLENEQPSICNDNPIYNSEQEFVKVEQINSGILLEVSQNTLNDNIDNLKDEHLEQEAKDDLIEAEKDEPKVQTMDNLRIKKIFDKF